MTASNARRARREGVRTNDNWSSFVGRFAGEPKTTINVSSGYDWLYNSSWIAGRIVDVVAEDMTREGVKLTGLEPAKEKQILREMSRLGAWNAVTDALKWARKDGGAAVYVDIDGQDPANPITTKNITRNSINAFVAREKIDFHPDSNELSVAGKDYGMPIFYRDGQSNKRVHISRAIRFFGKKPSYRELQSNNYWGHSVLQRIEDDVIHYAKAKNSAADLIKFALIRGIKTKGLQQAMSSGGDCQSAYEKRFSLMNHLQNYSSLTVIDSEDDLISNSYSFAGVPEVINKCAEACAAAEGIPMTKLMGQAPSGLNATGESDMRNYYDTVRMRQEYDLRDGITFIIDLVHRNLFGDGLPTDCEIEFKPLWVQSEKEQAEIAKLRIDALNTYTTSGLEMLLPQEQAGALLGMELRSLREQPVSENNQEV